MDISKVVMQRTLDAILTTANFKSAHGKDEKAEKEEEREMRTGYVLRNRAVVEPKRSSRAPKFPKLEGRVERGKF